MLVWKRYHNYPTLFHANSFHDSILKPAPLPPTPIPRTCSPASPKPVSLLFLCATPPPPPHTHPLPIRSPPQHQEALALLALHRSEGGMPAQQHVVPGPRIVQSHVWRMMAPRPPMPPCAPACSPSTKPTATTTHVTSAAQLTAPRRFEFPSTSLHCCLWEVAAPHLGEGWREGKVVGEGREGQRWGRSERVSFAIVINMTIASSL